MRKHNLYYLVLVVFVALTGAVLSCKGPAGPTGPQGPAGSNGADGEDGLPQPPLFDFFDIEASRTYSPSTWDDGSLELGQGIYALPNSLSVVVGNSGTGWASIILNEIRYCYQGGAASNSQESDVFNYAGVVPSNKECFQQTPFKVEPTFAVSDTATLTIAVNGGGCGSLCADTEIEGSVLGFLEVEDD